MSLAAIIKQYDEYARGYSNHIPGSMQVRSLANVLGHMNEPTKSSGVWIDAGCGSGSLAQMRKYIQPETVMGVDISKGIIGIAQDTGFYNECHSGDLSDLHMIEDESIDVYFSNSVLHWLNLIGKFPEALLEAHRVLKPNGTFAVSISGLGTARALMKILRDLSSQEGVNLPYRDFIGSLELYEPCELLKEIGFRIGKGICIDEPVMYDHPREYFKDVELYGKHIIMDPFTHFDDDQKDSFFKKLGDKFVEHMGDKEYRHTQYMIYIIAHKTERVTPCIDTLRRLLYDGPLA